MRKNEYVRYDGFCHAYGDDRHDHDGVHDDVHDGVHVRGPVRHVTNLQCVGLCLVS